MSSKPARVRKAANRNPTSLALPVPDPIPDPTPDPIGPQIDPRLTNINSTVDSTIDIADVVVYSPFSDAYATPPPIPGPIRKSTQSLPIEAVAIDDSQPAHTIQALQPTKKAFAWSFLIEQTLFAELLNQANNGKRANSGFKKEAWVAACVAVETITTQVVTVDQCKGKAEVMKSLWKEFI